MKKILFSIFIFLICFSVLECVVRAIWFMKYKTWDIDCKKTKIFINDPYTGYRLKPGYDARKEFNELCETDLPVIRGTIICYKDRNWRMSHKNDKTFTVNSLGFRGQEIEPDDNSKFIILALGGSTTMGNGVSDDETWPACLEKHLHDKGLINVKVINGGVGGFSSRNELRLFMHYGLKLNPKIVLVHDGWNEISLVWTLKDKWNKKYIGDLAYIAGTNKFVYNTPLLSIRLAYAAASRITNKIASSGFKNNAYSYTASLPLIKKDFWVKDWHENISALKKMAEDSGAEVYLLNYPGLCRKGSNIEEKNLVIRNTRVGNTVNYEFWVEVKDEINKAIKKNNDFRVLDTVNEFTGIKNVDYAKFFLDEMHMNAQGDDLFAEIIAEKLSADQVFLENYDKFLKQK